MKDRWREENLVKLIERLEEYERTVNLIEISGIYMRNIAHRETDRQTDRKKMNLIESTECL